EVYIPYDNHPSVHVVHFKPAQAVEKKHRVTEIKVPIFGNDATAIDSKKDLLYVASWGYGEINVVDLTSEKLVKRIRNVGIIPHMFNMSFNPNSGQLIVPIGASAVNGSFGSALTVLDPETEKTKKIYTGWAPTALTAVKWGKNTGFLVFNSEDQVARVRDDGSFDLYPLPPGLQCLYVNEAIKSNTGQVLAAYGPHQSYWPTVYIWGAKNGILGIDPLTMKFYDRRIPRMVQQMVLDKDGVLYALQNAWGNEKQFLITLPDDVRSPNLGQMRLELEDNVTRETTQRILEYDQKKQWLYIARVAERNSEPGILQIYDLKARKTLLNYPVGQTPTHLV
ncbi:MAG: hypothetical protein GY940_08620, partial [bacterium]|nr:hypothetical protein [bacterium]